MLSDNHKNRDGVIYMKLKKINLPIYVFNLFFQLICLGAGYMSQYVGSPRSF